MSGILEEIARGVSFNCAVRLSAAHGGSTIWIPTLENASPPEFRSSELKIAVFCRGRPIESITWRSRSKSACSGTMFPVLPLFKMSESGV